MRVPSGRGLLCVALVQLDVFDVSASLLRSAQRISSSYEGPYRGSGVPLSISGFGKIVTCRWLILKYMCGPCCVHGAFQRHLTSSFQALLLELKDLLGENHLTFSPPLGVVGWSESVHDLGFSFSPKSYEPSRKAEWRAET